MKGLLYTGRWLYALIFITSGITHFSSSTQAYAMAHGIPPWMTMLAGVMACVGGLCVATGFRAREGACLIAGFLAPVTLVMHRFWGLGDPAMAADQMAHFMKNLALFGAALMIVYEGSTPWSGREPTPLIRTRRAAHKVGPAELLTPGTRL